MFVFKRSFEKVWSSKATFFFFFKMKHKLHSFYVGVCYSLPVETGPEKVLLSRDRLEMCQKGFDDKPVICHVHFFMAFFLP